MQIVCKLFWLTIDLDFWLSANFIPEVDNVMADLLYWLSEPRTASLMLTFITVCILADNLCSQISLQ